MLIVGYGVIPESASDRCDSDDGFISVVNLLYCHGKEARKVVSFYGSIIPHLTG